MIIQHAHQDYDVDYSDGIWNINLVHEEYDIWEPVKGRLRKTLKRKYKEMQTTTSTYTISLMPGTKNWAILDDPINKKENNMGYEYNMEVDQRNHLKRRLDTVQREKFNEIRTKYHMDEDHPAKTKDEILAALKNGEIEFNDYFYTEKGALKDGYWPNGTFTLKNPLRNTEGYKAAEKLLGKAYTDAKDAIIVKPLTDGLAALQALEAQTF